MNWERVDRRHQRAVARQERRIARMTSRLGQEMALLELLRSIRTDYLRIHEITIKSTLADVELARIRQMVDSKG